MTPRNFRPEIQALRAVSVLLVILFHLWPTRLTGGYVGVDVFFVISGYLITSHLLRERDATGSIALRSFWARRIRRLLPAASLVLLSTLVATVVLVPQSAWQAIVREIAASALYIENWVLASSAVDYFAADEVATPLQHYWSLSVEEQFYLVWPLILLGLGALAVRRGMPVRRVLTVGVSIVAVISLAYSVWYSYTTPSAAYFSTFTHAWEFAAGALVALVVIPSEAMSSRVRAVMSWAGMALILGSGIVYTGATVFPGFLALIPIAGAILVIVAGDSRETRLSPSRAYSLAPVQFIGGISYSAYLWHWPLIVLLPWVLGRELGAKDKLVILAVTIVLAYLSKRFVEDPFRSSRRIASKSRFAYIFAFGSAALLVAGSAVPFAVVDIRTNESIAAANAQLEKVGTPAGECFGAAAMLSGAECPESFVADDSYLLATQIAKDEDKSADKREIVLPGGITAFEYGDPDAAKTIALIGDSHARHYRPAIRQIVAEHGWRLLVISKDSCSPSVADWVSANGYDSGPGCTAWRTQLLEELPSVPGIDVIVTSSVAPRYARETADVQAQAAAAFTEMWRAWVGGGKQVVVIADVPGPESDQRNSRDCVASHPDTVDPCSSPRDVVLETDAMVVAATETPQEGLTLLDLTSAYCDDETCHVVVGSIVVYGGGAHISNLFSRTLVPWIEPALVAAMGD